MKGHREESEVIVRFDQQDECIYICVCSWHAMCRKMNRLYGPSLDGNRGGQSARWKLPLKTVSFRRMSTVGKARRLPIAGFKRRVAVQSGVSEGGNE